jgi:hypothetical protein
MHWWFPKTEKNNGFALTSEQDMLKGAVQNIRRLDRIIQKFSQINDKKGSPREGRNLDVLLPLGQNTFFVTRELLALSQTYSFQYHPVKFTPHFTRGEFQKPHIFLKVSFLSWQKKGNPSFPFHHRTVRGALKNANAILSTLPHPCTKTTSFTGVAK